MDFYSTLLAKKLSGEGGGGSSVTVQPLSVTANGTYTAPSGRAYSPVSVDVPSFNIDAYLENDDIEIISNATSVKFDVLHSNNITKIILPECTTLGIFSISGGINAANGGRTSFSKLAELKLPKVSNIAHCSISYISGESPLKSVVLPSLSQVSTASNVRHFQGNDIKYYDFGNSSITAIDFGSGIPFFLNNYIEAIILRYGGVPSIGNTSFFHKTNLADIDLGNTAFVYVPSGLLEDYKVATNWATIYASYPNMFKTIEGSIYENAYADGTPIS